MCVSPCSVFRSVVARMYRYIDILSIAYTQLKRSTTLHGADKAGAGQAVLRIRTIFDRIRLLKTSGSDF
jgi:hypothetical protein